MLTPSIAQPETSERFRITSKRGFIYKRPIMCTLFSSLPIIVYHCIPGLAHEEKDRGIYQNMSDLVKKTPVAWYFRDYILFCHYF